MIVSVMITNDEAYGGAPQSAVARGIAGIPISRISGELVRDVVIP